MKVGEALRSAVPAPELDQTTILLGALAFAFFVYITVTPAGDGQTHLQKWLAIFGI